MFRPLAAAAAALATLALAGAASAQTYGQPVYLDAWGRPIGGASLSRNDIRSFVETGRVAAGGSWRPRIYMPAPAYGPYSGYGPGYGAYGHHRHGYAERRYDPPPRPGYRDAWGYNDDRPPSAWRGRSDRGYRNDRGCDCADVYFYDR